jgi:hypothetical protein
MYTDIGYRKVLEGPLRPLMVMSVRSQCLCVTSVGRA